MCKGVNDLRNITPFISILTSLSKPFKKYDFTGIFLGFIQLRK